MKLFDFLRNADINVGVSEYKVNDDAILLDVRTSEEYRDGHIDGSVKNKSTPLYVHCYSGSRSGQAVSYLKKIGYTSVKNIGGINSYRGKVVK